MIERRRDHRLVKGLRAIRADHQVDLLAVALQANRMLIAASATPAHRPSLLALIGRGAVRATRHE